MISMAAITELLLLLQINLTVPVFSPNTFPCMFKISEVYTLKYASERNPRSMNC